MSVPGLGAGRGGRLSLAWLREGHGGESRQSNSSFWHDGMRLSYIGVSCRTSGKEETRPPWAAGLLASFRWGVVALGKQSTN
jgi:hypothetical protein